jgi:predicted nucleic acid-binding protein
MSVTLAERSSGPHEVRPDTEQDVYFEAAERARRLDVLQRAEHEFDPIPFDADAARARGRVTAAVIATGRKPRRRAADLMIAATRSPLNCRCTRRILAISRAWMTLSR